MRDIITLACVDCKNRNYTTTKNKKTTPDKLELEEVLLHVPQAHGAQGDQVGAGSEGQ